MSFAQEFLNKHKSCDVSDLMKQLDSEKLVVSEQDYENETTEWMFSDSSIIIISDESVSIREEP